MRRVPLSSGLYIAVDAKGLVCNGTTNGPKLYVLKAVAIKKAGEGGKVICVGSSCLGVTAEVVWPVSVIEPEPLPPVIDCGCTNGCNAWDCINL